MTRNVDYIVRPLSGRESQVVAWLEEERTTYAMSHRASYISRELTRPSLLIYTHKYSLLLTVILRTRDHQYVMAYYQVCPPGVNATDPRAGDFILCHRKGFASVMIRWGERIRTRSGDRWSHAAFIETPETVIEALTHGVKRNPLTEYTDILYVLVRTDLHGDDQRQAVAFAQSCVGQEYGFTTDLGIALRFLTPGRGLWFGTNGTEICSGLVGQAMVRGWANFPVNPSALSPAELAVYYNVPSHS
jgi:hypothetical protein